MKIRECVARREGKLTEIRRHLHQEPEYSFKEYDTADYIFRYLETLRPDSLERIMKTGIKAVFLAKNPQKTVAIRADMDALPIEERNICNYRSNRVGLMHACGHDGHMAIALITAEIVCKGRETMQNSYVFLFQPAEETLGGALPMVREGALCHPDVDEIYGLHLWPSLPLGVIGARSGPLMAEMRDLNVYIRGKSSHGAKPQQGKDALVASAFFINALQSIISRDMDPYQAAVITIGRIEGGETRNVVCEEVSLEGTIRTFFPETTQLIKRRIGEMLEGTAKMFGVAIETKETMFYPAVVNPEKLFLHMQKTLEEDEWELVEPVMLSEDFSNYQAQIPGLFVFLGTSIDREAQPLHSNCFDFDERALMHGVEYFLRITGFEQSI